MALMCKSTIASDNMTTTPTPRDKEMTVWVKLVPWSELPKVRRAEALKMSRTPARIPITRKGRTGKVDDLKCDKTVWAMSTRMMTTSTPSMADTTVSGKPFHWRKKETTVLTSTVPAMSNRLATMAYSTTIKMPWTNVTSHDGADSDGG